uniref:Cilia- and flagella-associated protein 157 n=1 Tax=Amphilophus citrinellus TaxID=61819 RepID=A0A3Q0S4X8_AMPCI
MPRKNNQKRSDKQDERKKAPKRDGSEFPADKSASDHKEKELYLTQIGYLTDELERYQLKCDDLVRQKKDLLSQYSTLQQENREMLMHLETSQLKEEGEADELLQRLESERQAVGQERDALQLQHSQQRQELQDRVDKLIKENAALAERLASLEAFQKEKEKMMSSIESLEKQLASLEEEHKDDIHSLEMKALLEKKRLEREMESHAAAMAAEVQHLADQKVPETTRLVLQENVEVKARVRQLSEQAQVLMEENAALRDRKRQLSVDVENLEQMLSKTSRTSCVRKKVRERLQEGAIFRFVWSLCKPLDLQSNALPLSYTPSAQHCCLPCVFRQDQASLCHQCSKNRAEVSRLEAELQQERRRRSRMKSNMQEAAVTLRRALMVKQ